MQGSEQTPLEEDPINKKDHHWWKKLLIILLAAFGVAAFVLTLFDSVVQLARLQDWISLIRVGIGIVVVPSILCLHKPEIFIVFYNRLHGLMSHLVPWLVVFGLVLSIIIYIAVRPSQKTTTIPLLKRQGATYNSWDHYPQLTQYITAFGEPGDSMWVVDEEGAAHFSYQINPNIQQNDPNASSGGYMAFYETPCDRLSYHEVSFDGRAIVPKGSPDVGIRLTVDDPTQGFDREVAIYEIPSLKAYYKGQRQLDKSWQTFTFDLNNFERKLRSSPRPGVDVNFINKIVFFVNNEMVGNCPEGTLWFRNLRFRSDKP